MSHEALQPRQFGNYITRPKGYNNIVAEHANSGRSVGYLSWLSGDKTSANPRPIAGEADPTKPVIYKTVVSSRSRRKGIATAMLDHARAIAPDLQHAGPQALTEDGAAFAKARP
jgi:GNAT superfamily N-acetyltransferase